MIRLIVSDIDGTLTEDGGSRLDPELYEVILKLKSQGIYFAAASGRHSASIEYIFDPIKDKIFYIGDNGAYLGCYGRELFLTRLYGFQESGVSPVDVKRISFPLKEAGGSEDPC